MNRSTLVHFAAAVVIAGFAWTNARAADDTCRSGFVWREAFRGDHVCVTPATRDQTAAARRVAAQPPAGTTPAAVYRLSEWSGWGRAGGIEYRYRWGWNPQDSRYATRVDAIFEMRNRQAQKWDGAARSVDCERDAVSMSTRVVLQTNETKEVTFMTANCGSRTNPSFRPNVVKSVRIDP